MRTVNEAGLKLIKSFEQLRLLAYDDARPDFPLREGDKILGTLTVGYGHTGADVKIGQKITREDADRLLDGDLLESEDAVRKAVTYAVNDNHFSALVSFAFNVGVAAFKSSTLLKKVNAGDLTGAAAEFDKWVKTTVGGQKVTSKGLVRRRTAEKELFTRPLNVAPQANIPYSPEPLATAIGEAPAKTPAKDVTFLGVATSIGSGVLAEATSQLEPLIAYSETIKAVFVALSLASVGFVMWKRWSDLKKEAA